MDCYAMKEATMKIDALDAFGKYIGSEFSMSNRKEHDRNQELSLFELRIREEIESRFFELPLSADGIPIWLGDYVSVGDDTKGCVYAYFIHSDDSIGITIALERGGNIDVSPCDIFHISTDDDV